MNKTLLTEAHVRVEHIPAHKYVGVWDIDAADYGKFWDRWNYDPTTNGYEWNEDVCQDYQRHYPEVIGYEILRPVRRIKK